jgi:UDP-N-acetylglucosamine pyrophosphorylase
MLVSNIDNLGGIPDAKFMNNIASENVPFLVETATKLKDD